MAPARQGSNVNVSRGLVVIESVPNLKFISDWVSPELESDINRCVLISSIELEFGNGIRVRRVLLGSRQVRLEASGAAETGRQWDATTPVSHPLRGLILGPDACAEQWRAGDACAALASGMADKG